MIKRKFFVSIFLSIIITLIFSIANSTLEGYGGFLDGWFFYALIIFPCLLIYALPASILAEQVTTKIDNQILRSFYSLLIHLGAALILWVFSPFIAIYATIVAFLYFIIDEMSKKFVKHSAFQHILNIISITFVILSVGLWIIAAIKVYSY